MKQSNNNTVEKWVRVMFLPFYLFTLLSLTVSCSESTDAIDEYADWQSRNDAYFEQQYQSHDKANVIRKWSLEEAVATAHTDHILIDKFKEGTGTKSPYYTDTVSIHYVGRLIPSVSYPAGYEFEKSWKGTFDAETAVPSEFAVGSSDGLINGMVTALLHMHRGDRWRVIVPYQLAYGSTARDDIPAYSNLIFEIELKDFWSVKKGDRKD